MNPLIVKIGRVGDSYAYGLEYQFVSDNPIPYRKPKDLSGRSELLHIESRAIRPKAGALRRNAVANALAGMELETVVARAP